MEAIGIACQIIHKLHIVENRKLRRRRGGGGSQIRYKVRNGGIRFMSHSGNDGGVRIENSLGHRLFVKGPKILYGAATSTYNQHIQAHLIQSGNSLTNGSHSPLTLYQSRIEEKLHKRVSPLCDLDNVSYRRS